MIDKREFLDNTIQQVRALDISLIIGSYIPLTRKGRSYLGLCPFHNDTKLGSFVVTPHKGIFKCFTCDGVAGDAIKFVSLYRGVNYVEATFQIALEYGVINSQEYEEFFSRKRYSAKDVAKIERKYQEISKKAMQSEVAEPEILDKVYRLFFKSGELTSDHMDYLIKRGISEEVIEKRGYKTFPTRHVISLGNEHKSMPKGYRSFKDYLKENGLDMSVLEKVPGFYQERQDDGSWKWTFSKNKGIMIPIKNALGQIIGIQIRRDKVNEGEKRYIWFSSSFACFDDKLNYGCSPGSPIAVVYPTKVKSATIIITEGHFKAELIAELMGCVVISVQGVSSWKHVLDVVETIKQQLREQGNKFFEIKRFYVMFDADMTCKFQVYGQAKKMTDTIIEKYPAIDIYYINWDEKQGKGFDDLVENHGNEYIKYIRKYEKSIWDMRYSYVSDMLISNEGYESLSKVPQETLNERVQEYVIAFLANEQAKQSIS